MRKNFQQKFMLRLFVIFIAITASALLLGNQLDAKKIDHIVVIAANALLFMLTAIIMLLHLKAARNANPNVFVRSVMGATALKLLAIIVALAIYLFTAGPNRSVYAIAVGMGLYVLYTVIEVRAVLQLNQRKDGKN